MNKTVNLPIDSVVAVTYLCNSRCVMCDIWKNQEKEMPKPEAYQKLPASLKYINVSGGEPFLRNDIVEVVENMKKAAPKAKIVISSNGFLTEKIVEKMKQMPEGTGIALSLDGIGKMHDEIRGIPGAFDKTLETMEQLQKAGIKNLRFAFTVSTVNVDHLRKVYDLSEKYGVELTMAFAQSSEFYFGGKENYENPDEEELKKQFSYVINSELKKFKPKRWLRAYFAHGLFQFATKNEQLLYSPAGEDFFFLDPFGKIYPSVVHNHVLGNINEQKFEDIWFSENADKIRKQVKDNEKKVWMICTARTAIIRNPFKVFKWILKTKFIKW